jgi:hypothetical protein
MVPTYDQTFEDIQTKKAVARVQRRIWNLVDEFHKKTAKWICENYGTVFLQKFET